MATVTIKIPTNMRPLTGGADRVPATGQTVDEVITDLDTRHPGLRARLYDEAGGLRRFINIYANEDDIRFLDNLDTALSDGDDLSIIPAIAGGL